MSRFKNKIAFVVATKERPQELRRMLNSLRRQSYLPDQIIIVDGGVKQVNKLINEFPELNIKYLYCIPPSASRQRNTGIKVLNSEISLVGFLDDDVELEADALVAMMDFWERAPGNIGAASFNMINHPQLYAPWLKSLHLVKRLGLYSKDRGIVVPSGFHTNIGYVQETIFVQWLPTCGLVCRRGIFEKFQFDEFFSGYSYLEDLDFSYQVGKEYQLAVVANARFYHYPASTGRGSGYLFGKREVANRIYFVKKHKELSLFKCYLALIIRIFVNLGLTIKAWNVDYFQRVLGNIVELAQSVITHENY